MNRLILLLLAWFSLCPTTGLGQTLPRTDYLGDPLPAGALNRLGTTRLRHLGGCDMLQFTEGGKSLVVFGWQDWPTAWDVESGKRIKTDATQFELLDKATGNPVLARFHPALWSAKGLAREGNTLLAADYDHVVTAWDLASGKATRKKDESEGFVPAWDRSELNSARLRYLDPLTGEEKQVTSRWSAIWRNWSLSDSVDPEQGRRLKVHYRSSGEEPKSESPETVALPTADFANGVRIRLNVPEKKLVVLVFWEYVAVKDLENDNILWEKEVGPVNESGRGSKQVRVNCLALSPDGKTLAAGTDSGHIDLLDLTTGQPVGGSRFHPGFFSGPAQIVPGGKYLVVPMGREAVLWDLATGKKVRGLGADSGEDLHLPAPDGRSLLVSHYTQENTHQVSLEETVSGKKLWTLPDRFTLPPEAHFSTDGRIVAIEGAHVSANLGMQLAAADITEARFLPDAKMVRQRAGVKNWRAIVSPDGRLIADYVWNEPSPGEFTRVASHFEVRDVQSKDTVLRLDRGPPSRILSMRTGPYGCFSSDNKIFAYRSGDSLVFYDLETKQQLGPARHHAAPIWDMTFAPSGYVLAAYCNDSTIMVWDATATR